MGSREHPSMRGPRTVVVALVAALLVWLVMRAGPGRLLENAKTIGWGMLLVIAMAGLAHLVKTWAWRFALGGESKQISFWHTFRLRLISEAMGQFGFVGLVFGESSRVALLGSGVSPASAISSVAMDRGLFIATGVFVTISGLIAAALLVVFSGVLRLYASVFVLALLCFLGMYVLAIHKGWPLFSRTAHTAGRIPWLRAWIASKKAVIESAERQFLQFHRRAPRAFWASAMLNLASQVLAIAEVYLILNLLGLRASFVSALILESLTKLINVIGGVNPGNLGTYEGGNMVIGRWLGLSGAQGLTLGLCRRLRAVFWALVGGLCLAWHARSPQPADQRNSDEIITRVNPCSE
jgi:hypothetical protein